MQNPPPLFSAKSILKYMSFSWTILHWLRSVDVIPHLLHWCHNSNGSRHRQYGREEWLQHPVLHLLSIQACEYCIKIDGAPISLGCTHFVCHKHNIVSCFLSSEQKTLVCMWGQESAKPTMANNAEDIENNMVSMSQWFCISVLVLSNDYLTF